MLLDLNDPNSIVRWWEVYPERHGPLLKDLAALRPQYRHAINAAGQLIEGSPRLRDRLERARAAEAAWQERLAAGRAAWDAADDDAADDPPPPELAD
ncbi:hypothetical protein LZ017_07245 [Pelomonas sp. CA6]|uniref:hypothetical protein n=1 Tax=Pelomonas sp. CA6 TaxID=2907999 RepID=UPI001F4C447E|nr:hypothetical protein [Pelomonas sp. CA6]MCH7343173.1 hypothetical protein [Pelomonas sp. CA6]